MCSMIFARGKHVDRSIDVSFSLVCSVSMRKIQNLNELSSRISRNIFFEKVIWPTFSSVRERKGREWNELIDLDDLKQCFDSSMISNQRLHLLVEQISQAIKECYHVTPDALLNLLFIGCNHSIVRVKEIRDDLFHPSVFVSSRQWPFSVWTLLLISIVCTMSKTRIHHRRDLVWILSLGLFFTLRLNIPIWSFGNDEWSR